MNDLNERRAILSSAKKWKSTQQTHIFFLKITWNRKTSLFQVSHPLTFHSQEPPLDKKMKTGKMIQEKKQQNKLPCP